MFLAHALDVLSDHLRGRRRQRLRVLRAVELRPICELGELHESFASGVGFSLMCTIGLYSRPPGGPWHRDKCTCVRAALSAYLELLYDVDEQKVDDGELARLVRKMIIIVGFSWRIATSHAVPNIRLDARDRLQSAWSCVMLGAEGFNRRGHFRWRVIARNESTRRRKRACVNRVV